MKKLLIAGSLFLMLAACKSNNGWSQADKDAFVKGCIPQAQQSGSMDAAKAKDYCECMLDKVEKKYAKVEDAASLTATDASEMAKDCLK